eukprot:6013835-Pyramimonas_sp.AAC.1
MRGRAKPEMHGEGAAEELADSCWPAFPPRPSDNTSSAIRKSVQSRTAARTGQAGSRRTAAGTGRG